MLVFHSLTTRQTPIIQLLYLNIARGQRLTALKGEYSILFTAIQASTVGRYQVKYWSIL